MSVARLGDRCLFPDLDTRVYLGHAAISPPSLPVREAVARMLDDYARRGMAAFGDWHAQRQRLRAKLGRLIGARPEEIGLVPNTSLGVAFIAHSIMWRVRDRVILFKGEFPANVAPWLRAAELYGLEPCFLALDGFRGDAGEGLGLLERELQRGARLVAVSAVQFQTGLAMPLAEIGALCRRHGAELFVDAIQMCGARPLSVDESNIDYLACGGHKWLMGPEGAGFLFVREARAQVLRPAVTGWLSHEDTLGFLLEGPNLLRYDRPLKKRAEVFEGGNYNSAGFAGLEAAVDILLGLGVETIARHVDAYLDALAAKVSARGLESLRDSHPARRSSILGALPPPGVDVVTLWRKLSERGVACSIPDGVLRFAPHWPNALAEIDLVAAALDESLG